MLSLFYLAANVASIIQQHYILEPDKVLLPPCFNPMIPPFLENGYLPPGLHTATIDEIAERFGRESELRRVQMESVRWMVDLARQAGAERIVLNGSFVTDIIEPNDVDCVLLLSPGIPIDLEAEEALDQGLPFLDIAMVGRRDFERLTERTFATDRHQVPKGMVEVIL